MPTLTWKTCLGLWSEGEATTAAATERDPTTPKRYSGDRRYRNTFSCSAVLEYIKGVKRGAKKGRSKRESKRKFKRVVKRELKRKLKREVKSLKGSIKEES